MSESVLSLFQALRFLIIYLCFLNTIVGFVCVLVFRKMVNNYERTND